MAAAGGVCDELEVGLGLAIDTSATTFATSISRTTEPSLTYRQPSLLEQLLFLQRSLEFPLKLCRTQP
jgi:hypothetical protein